MVVLDVRRCTAASHHQHVGGNAARGGCSGIAAAGAAWLWSGVVHRVDDGFGVDPSVAGECRGDGDRGDSAGGRGTERLDDRRRCRFTAPPVAAARAASTVQIRTCGCWRGMALEFGRHGDPSPAIADDRHFGSASGRNNPCRRWRPDRYQSARCRFSRVSAGGGERETARGAPAFSESLHRHLCHRDDGDPGARRRRPHRGSTRSTSRSSPPCSAHRNLSFFSSGAMPLGKTRSRSQRRSPTCCRLSCWRSFGLRFC